MVLVKVKNLKLWIGTYLLKSDVKTVEEAKEVETSEWKIAALTVAKYVANNGGKILKMICYEVGEGMKKRNDNFAEEVMSQVKGN